MRRKALIAFDANVATKSKVGQARQALAETLVGWGAEVFFVELPHAEGVNGPDDFIAAHGGEAFVKLMDTAKEWRKIITLRPGECPEAVDIAEEILLAHAERLRIFQRGSEIVRVVTLEKAQQDGRLDRQPGTIQLAPVSAIALMEDFERLIIWQRFPRDQQWTSTGEDRLPSSDRDHLPFAARLLAPARSDGDRECTYHAARWDGRLPQGL